MKKLTLLLTFAFCFSFPCFAQQGKLVLLSPQMIAIGKDEVESLSEEESVKHKDGGYIENAAVVGCFAALSYRYTGGRYRDEEIRFRLHSPESIVPNKKYPLLIWLHGAGESGDDNRRQLAHMQSTIEFLVGDNKMDFYLLATQCPADNQTWENSISSEGKGDAPLTIMKEILDIMLEEYPIDRNRISFYGQCSGAHGAWHFLEMYPELVSAMTAFSTTPPTGLVWDERYRKTSFWAFNNLDDQGIPVEPMQKFVQQINDSGGLGYLTIRKTGGHDTWAAGMKKDKVVAWLVLQDRERFSPPPGVVVRPHAKAGRQFVLCVLPILLSVPLIIFKFKRRSIRKQQSAAEKEEA